MLILFQIANHFPVHSFVLERAMQNDEDFGRDSPIVQVRDVAFENEFKCADWAYLVLVLSIQTLQKIFQKQTEAMN